MLQLSSKIFLSLLIPALPVLVNAHSGHESVSPCSDAVVLDRRTIQVGDNQVVLSGLSCPSDPGLESSNRDRAQAKSSLTTRTTRDVCGEPCTNLFCFTSGSFPIASDCAIIADALTILSTNLGPTYQLNATNGYYKQLVFGTCLTYIGVSAEEDTEACWSDWITVITDISDECNTPARGPYGACTSFPPDLTYADFSMGLGHS
ncbi:hypothetical protein HMN09_01276700 [Mycena chlorophos]|uniref:Uncharacterized protein n=1 Tax=Mycena chlorophos TaxID=658473 RepID=A0A8H6S453_MYCCL|nr:hypothetical protein HMN09_01276700 [Mycena chlorophos]